MLRFKIRLGLVRGKYLPAGLHAAEASHVSISSLASFRAASGRAVWSSKMPMASTPVILNSLDGPVGVDPAFHVIWARFRMMRGYLAYRPDEVSRVYLMLDLVARGAGRHGPVHLLLDSAAEIGFALDGYLRVALLPLRMLAGPLQHFRAAIWQAWQLTVTSQLAQRKGFRRVPFADIRGSLLQLISPHLRTRGRSGVTAPCGALLGVPSLADSSAEAMYGRTLRYLLKKNLARKEEEEERRRAQQETSQLEQRGSACWFCLFVPLGEEEEEEEEEEASQIFFLMRRPLMEIKTVFCKPLLVLPEEYALEEFHTFLRAGCARAVRTWESVIILRAPCFWQSLLRYWGAQEYWIHWETISSWVVGPFLRALISGSRLFDAGTAEATAPLVDVPVNMQLKFQQFSSSTWRCPRLSSSTEWWIFWLRYRETSTQCKTVQKSVVGAVLGSVRDAPVVVQRHAGQCRKLSGSTAGAVPSRLWTSL